MLNFIVSVVTAVAVAVALGQSNNAVLQVFGVWAALAGLFRLVTAARRWKSYGAQWAMILSGAQSILAGGLMLKMAGGPDCTTAVTTGGRDGKTRIQDGTLELILSTPKELGGTGRAGTNPEQLLAAGYSACFLGAVKSVAHRLKLDVPDDASAIGWKRQPGRP